MSKVTMPCCDESELGDTYLTIKEINGHLFVVDQHGKVINGLISCSAKSEVDCLTEITLKVYSQK